MDNTKSIKPKQKVLILVTHLHKGGMQRAISNLSKLLYDAKIDHQIVYFGKEEIVFRYNCKLIDLNLPGKSNDNVINRIIRLFLRVISLQKLINNNPTTCIVSFGIISNIINLLTIKKKSIITFGSFSEVNSLYNHFRYFHFSFSLLYLAADKIICVSSDLKDELLFSTYGLKKKTIVINNIVNIEEIQNMANHQLSEKYNIIFSNPVVINMSSLVSDKGHIYLINAFNEAKKQVNNLQLVIIGSGPNKDVISQHIEDLGLTPCVHLLGFKSNPFKYLSKADIYISTSLYEGFPNSIIEAMICKLPIISTNCKTGPSEILSNNSGILVNDINDYNQESIEKEISRHILYLLNPDINNYYRSQSYNRSKSYSIEILSKEWTTLFDSVGFDITQQSK